MSDDRECHDGRCDECGSPQDSRHRDACSGVHRDDFVGVPRKPGPGVVHLASDSTDVTVCCGIRHAAVPHSDGLTESPEWATCQGGSDA